VGAVGAVCTILKDKSDQKARDQAVARQTVQAQYANFAALLPLMASNDDKQVSRTDW